MTPAGTLTGLGARAGYPQLTVPAGYDATTRNPVNISFNGDAFSEASAARARLRVRAGDARAQGAERDQPGLVALRARQRAAAAVLPARRSAAAEGVGPRAPLTGLSEPAAPRIVIVAFRNLPRVAGLAGS